MRESDLNGFNASYKEHWQKAVKALGDPNKCQDINGWLRRLKDFAEKIREECISIQDRGQKVTSIGDNNDVWSRQQVEDYFAKQITDILRLREQNDEIARQNGIRLAEPWSW